jgi:hypothetical protein
MNIFNFSLPSRDKFWFSEMMYSFKSEIIGPGAANRAEETPLAYRVWRRIYENVQK